MNQMPTKKRHTLRNTHQIHWYSSVNRTGRELYPPDHSHTHTYTHTDTISATRERKNGFLWVFYSNDRYHKFPHRDFYSTLYSPYRSVALSTAPVDIATAADVAQHCRHQSSIEMSILLFVCAILKYSTLYNRMQSGPFLLLLVLLLLLLLSRFSY